MDYFIDESGQTGDVARLNTLSSFNDQPVLCLAAIGVAAEFSLEQEIRANSPFRGKRGVWAACTRGTCAMKMCAWWISISCRCPADVVGVRRSGG